MESTQLPEPAPVPPPEPLPEPVAEELVNEPVPQPQSRPSTAPAGPTRTSVTVVQQLVLQPEQGEQTVAETVEDLRKQKAENDFSGEYGKRVYTKRHYHSMTPIVIIFMLGGRFPFNASKQPDGTYLYHFNWFYPLGIYFLVSTITMFGTLIFGLWNVAHVVLNITVTSHENTTSYQQQREHEDVLIHRYSIPLIFVYSSLIHGCIAAVLIMKKRHYIAHYLTFWSKAVYTMHMDVSKKARGFSVTVLIFFIIIVVTIVLLSVFKIGPTAVGLPTVFGDLSFRMFTRQKKWLLRKTKTRTSIQIAGAFVLIFTFTASKSSIIFFIYHCKTLQSAFAYWNGRVYAAVLRGGEFAQTEEGRTTYKLLFKDHCILMDLMEGMDQVFAFTVESYFGCQVFSLFFELYFCIRIAKHGDNQLAAAYPEPYQQAYFVRPRDWLPGVIMLVMSVMLMFSAAKSAADVAEEAMAGLEVLRRKTMLGRKTDEELYFMLSMFSSYTAYKKMEISAGGYYYMNKEYGTDFEVSICSFVIGLISSVLSYFIILYQFQPVMDVPFPANTKLRPDRVKYGKFLIAIEGLHAEHYETTTSKNDLFSAFRN